MALAYEAAMAAATGLVANARHVAIMSHINPDGDTIGSALALAHGLRKLGKTAVAVCSDTLPDNLAFMPGYAEIQTQGRLPADTDLVILVDSSDPTRFGDVHEQSADIIARAHVLNLDHHATNSYFGEVNLVNPAAAAVGEMVYALLKELGVAVDLPLAICLLTAVVTDTRCFRTLSTTPQTMAIAAELFAAGAPLGAIVQSVYHNRTPSMLRVWGIALTRMQVTDGIAWTGITREMQAQAGASPTEGDGVVDLMSSMGQVKAVVVFRETDGGTKVSLRATDGFDVASAAAHFGGGGHPRAAGCFVPGNIDEVERLVVDYLTDHKAAR